MYLSVAKARFIRHGIYRARDEVKSPSPPRATDMFLD